MEIVTNNSSQTKKLGETLAKKIKFRKANKALVLGLIGDLGGGKTTFLQGFAKGLGIKQKVLSPTFVIMKKYELESRKWRVGNRKKTTNHFLPSTFYHIDCYRIKKPKEILDLGFKKIASDPKNIVAVEWAERIKKIMPKNTIWIKFEFVDKNKRKIKISNNYS
jgi:tRNA threonylcarbamoyladenosine biosynthesis protein TsaE